MKLIERLLRWWSTPSIDLNRAAEDTAALRSWWLPSGPTCDGDSAPQTGFVKHVPFNDATRAKYPSGYDEMGHDRSPLEDEHRRLRLAPSPPLGQNSDWTRWRGGRARREDYGVINPVPMCSPASFKLNAERSVAVATDYFWNEDMAACPRGVKVQLLGQGGVAVYGTYSGDSFWSAWAPCPKRR